MKSTRLLAVLFVLFWSSGYVVGALALEVSSPALLLEARFSLAALIALPFALRGGRWRGAPLRRLMLLGALLQFVQFAGVYGGVAAGVAPGLAALVMTGLSPLATTALSVAGGQERGSARIWIGLTIGVAGVGLGLVPDLGEASIGAGLLLTGLGLAGLASGTVLQKRWGGGSDPFVAVAVQSATAAALMAPILAVGGGHFDLGPKLILCLVWIAAGLGVLTVLILIEMLRRRDASQVGALLLLVPAVTALASAPVLGEPLHPLSFVGMAVAAVGVGSVLRGGGARRRGASLRAAAPSPLDPPPPGEGGARVGALS